VLRDVLELEGSRRMPRVFISAQGGEGMNDLRAILSEAVAGELEDFLNPGAPAPHDIRLAPEQEAHDLEETPAAHAPHGTHHSLA
jgi:GTP-binding protein HflX